MADKESKEQAGLTPEQLQALMASFTEAMKVAVQEARRPNEFEQKKLDEERAKLVKLAKMQAELGKVEMERKQRQRENCSHTKQDGKHAWRAQVNTGDQCFVPTCVMCATQTPKIPATSEQLTNGVNLELYPQLSLKVLENWHRVMAERSGCREDNCYLCAAVAVGA